MQLDAHNYTVSVDMMNIDLTTFRVYVNEYFHHAVRFRLARVLVLFSAVLLAFRAILLIKAQNLT